MSPLNLTFDSPAAAELESDAAFWRIYALSFPSGEREPAAAILATVKNGAGFAVRARAAGVTVGLACAHILHDPHALFLVYLAVTPEMRSGGVGTALFSRAWDTAALSRAGTAAPCEGAVWEVEIPELAPNPTEGAQRRRRLAFFGRLGAHLLPQPYLQPAIDGIAPVPMRLMYRPAPGGSWPDTPKTAALVRAIYFQKYGAINGITDAALEDLLRRVPPA